MATADVIMPKMGDGMETGTLLSWKKSDGDQVKTGDIIAEIATDKANVEVQADDSGIFKTQIAEGETVPVGAVIATIGDGKGGDAAKPKAAAVAKSESAPSPQTPAKQPQQAPAPAATTSASNGAGRIKASPLARRIAGERGVALSALRGTGPNGRIIEADVLAAAQSGSAQASPKTPAATPTQLPAEMGETRDLSPMRRAIARRMVESKTQIPHFYLTAEIDMEAAVDLRKQLNSYDDSLPKVSLNDFIVKASAQALIKVPDVNRIWQGDKYLQPANASVGIAVAIEDGLIVPVVKDANTKSLRKVAREGRELIEKARNRKLLPAEYSGGTFTVSNLGSFDIDSFIAIIDPSQGAILAVGSIRKIPVVLPDDTIAVRQRMNVTLSGDHRVMDGAAGARFLQELKRLLQNPISLLEQ